MIRVRKPSTVPAVLAVKGAEERRRLCALYDSGTKEFTFKSVIYGDESVKAALILAQAGKCCFCERKVSGDGDIEHFRPKSGFSQGCSQAIEKPGYYWLAYDWSNLYLSCSSCNSRQKRNQFPLLDPAKRARCHSDDLTEEAPLLIDPGTDDPDQHLGFRAEVAYGKNKRGKETKDALNLNRSALTEARRDRLQIMKLLAEALPTVKDKRIAADFRALLSEAISDKGEFAAAVRAAIGSDFDDVLG